MIFELNEFHRNINSNELIEDLRHVAEFLNQDTVTIDDYNQHGRFHATTLTRRFGSWFNCLSRAGLKPSRSKIGISDEELFEEIENIITVFESEWNDYTIAFETKHCRYYLNWMTTA